MSKTPKISIITPSYNQGEFIEECILSVISQEYPNLEFIIIDGGSNDNTLDVIKKYEKKLTYWISEKDNGQSHAINKGLQIATGDIINWLNADDFYPPNTLNLVGKIMQENNTLCICGKCQVFKNPNTLMYQTNGTDIYSNSLAKTIGWARTDQPATFYHKEAITKIGNLDENLHYLMDRDWWVKFLMYFGLQKIQTTEAILANFRLHEKSKTVSQTQLFEKDRNSYFYSFAKNYEFYNYSNFLEDNEDIKRDYQVKSLPQNQETSFIEEILNFFILQKAEEYYYQNFNKKAKKYLKFVQKKLLKGEDKKLYSKIKFRNNYVPNLIIRLFRKK